jgi:hypothetical protein
MTTAHQLSLAELDIITPVDLCGMGNGDLEQTYALALYHNKYMLAQYCVNVIEYRKNRSDEDRAFWHFFFT